MSKYFCFCLIVSLIALSEKCIAGTGSTTISDDSDSYLRFCAFKSAKAALEDTNFSGLDLKGIYTAKKKTGNESGAFSFVPGFDFGGASYKYYQWTQVDPRLGPITISVRSDVDSFKELGRNLVTSKRYRCVVDQASIKSAKGLEIFLLEPYNRKKQYFVCTDLHFGERRGEISKFSEFSGSFKGMQITQSEWCDETGIRRGGGETNPVAAKVSADDTGMLTFGFTVGTGGTVSVTNVVNGDWEHATTRMLQPEEVNCVYQCDPRSLKCNPLKEKTSNLEFCNMREGAKNEIEFLKNGNILLTQAGAVTEFWRDQ